MKLTKIALSLIIIAGAAITGGSWYTGKQAEEKYPELVALANQELKQLKAYGIEAQLNNVTLERGIFSSGVKYQLDAKVDDKTLVFTGNDELFHGPLPLNRLKQGNFAPVLASIETNLSAPEILKAAFDNKAILTASNSISYQNEIEGAITLNPWKAEIEEDKGTYFQMSEGKATYLLNKEGKGTTKFNIPRFEFKSNSEELEMIALGTSYQFNITDKNSIYENLGLLGDYVAEIESISVKLPKDQNDTNPLVELKEFKSKGHNKVNNERSQNSVDSNIKIFLGKEGKTLSSIGTLTSYQFIDAAAKPLNELMGLFKDPAFMEESQEKGSKALSEVLQTEPRLHLNFSLQTNEKNKIDLSLILNLNKFNPENMASFEEIISGFKQSSLTLNANIAAIEELVKNLQQATESEALRDPAAIVAHIITQAKSSDAFVVDAESVKLKVDIDGGKVKLNDKELSEEEVQGILFILIMSLGGMGL